MRKLTRNVVFSTVSMGANYIFPLAALPFLTRALGSNPFGEFAIAQATSIVLCQLVDFGFILVAAREVATVKGTREISDIYSRIQNIRLLLAFFALLIVFALSGLNILPISSQLLVATAVPAVLGTLLQATWLFQGRGFFGWLALANFISRLTFFLIVLLFIKDPADLTAAGFAFGGAYLISGILLAAVAPLTGIVWKIRFHFGDLVESISKGLHGFLSLALLSIHTQLLVAIVGVFVGPASAGLLSAADRVLRGIAAVAIPFANALFPTFSKLYVEPNDDVHVLRGKVLSGLACVSLLGTIGLLWGADYIAALMMPLDAGNLAYLLRLISPAPILVSVGVVYGGLTLVPAGHDRDYLRAIFLGELAALTAFIAMFFIDRHLSGLAGILVAEGALSLLMFLAVKVRIDTRTLFKIT